MLIKALVVDYQHEASKNKLQSGDMGLIKVERFSLTVGLYTGVIEHAPTIVMEVDFCVF